MEPGFEGGAVPHSPSAAAMGAAAHGAAGPVRAVLLLKLLLAFLVITSSTTQAIVFTLPSGRAKCITKVLRRPAVSVASYRIADSSGNGITPHGHKICARVSGPKGKRIRQAESVESGELAFVAKKAGRYSACIWSPGSESLPSSVSVDFDWRTGNATQSSSPVSRKSKASSSRPSRQLFRKHALMQMQAQTQKAQVGNYQQPMSPEGSNPSATATAKASAVAGDMASAETGAEDEQDDDDDNEDSKDKGGGKED